MNKFLKKNVQVKQTMNLKEKVAANFNTAKADAILEKAGVERRCSSTTIHITKETNVLVLCAGGGTSGLACQCFE